MRLIVKRMLNRDIVTWATYLFMLLMIIGTTNAWVASIKDHETHDILDGEGMLINLIFRYVQFGQ